MDKIQAHNIVKDTLESSFDKNKFIYFTKNILNNVDESKAFHARGYVPEIFKDYVRTYERVGTYTDPNGKKLDILIVYLQRESSIERARTSQRNFAARYLKDRGMKDAGLIAFVSPNGEDWRFSFVKMEYQFKETAKGTVKVEEEFTPAKRYSFLVGSNENSHTAQSRLVPLLQMDERNPRLDEVEDLFSVEKATKEFFDKYRELYLRTHDTLETMLAGDKALKTDFEAKNVSVIDFCKKLLGQIVFLYFLQRKGWFGVPLKKSWGDGDRHFLRSLFEHASHAGKNYFNDYLEPLFYEALARERTDDYYSRFECRIPFLNGGLFDPINNYDWVNTVINFPNELFSNNTTKEGDRGDGILDMFDRFNFTVKEDEPLEKEVAVDPEMLGKVFENLLEVKDRKSKGTYYTPREIVHYMCVQSLINYLATELDGKVARDDLEKLIKHGESVGENEARVEKKGEETGTYYYKLPETIREYAALIDEKLANIKVCDPAIGSGAFPVGMMTEIVRARTTLSSYLSGKNRTTYIFKRHCIHNSIYGVDIDPGAIEIAKLRLWLSLIVDEEDIKQIKPLPNLDYKIMQGNSLLEEYEGIKLFDENLIAGINETERRIKEIKDKISQLENELLALHRQGKLTRQKEKELRDDAARLSKILKRVASSQDGKELNVDFIKDASIRKQKADKLKQLHEAFFDSVHAREKAAIKKEIEALEWELIEATLKEQGKTSELKRLEEFKKANTKPFFLWKLNFAEVFQEKDGFDVVIANPPYVGESGHKEIFREIKQGNLGIFYQGKMDLFYFFIHLSLNLGGQHASIAFITTNYYLTATGANKLRQDLKTRSMIRNLIDFNELKIFESARGQHNMVTVFEKGQDENFIVHTCTTQRHGLATHDILQQMLAGSDKHSHYYKVIQEDLYDGNNNYIRLTGHVDLASNPLQSILNKIRDQGTCLSNLCFINQGIVSGCDYVSSRNLGKLKKRNDIELNDGIFVFNLENPRDVEVVNTFNDKERKLLRPFFKNSDISRYWCKTMPSKLILYSQTFENLDHCEYPHILDHLNKFRMILEQRLIAYGEDYHWRDLHRSRTENIFIGEKITVPYRTEINAFAHNNCDWFCRSDSYLITLKDKDVSLKYVLSLLNSKLFFLWLYHRGKRKGEILELFQTPLSEIPIKKISKPEQQPFVAIVDKILAITKDEDYPHNPAKQSKVIEYEKQIDQIVYKLFGLTDNEIELVERPLGRTVNK